MGGGGAPLRGRGRGGSGAARITKNLVLFQLAGGVLTEMLDVSAGRHQVRVEVRWSDQRRTQEIAGRFRPGEAYRLEIRLGRARGRTCRCAGRAEGRRD